MESHKRVLVAILKSPSDWEIARDRHWYRIPLRHAPKQPDTEWITFYQPSAFGQERWGVHVYARIRETHTVRRIELFPAESSHPRAEEPYLVYSFDPPVRLAHPLVSSRPRRFVWTMTTWWRFTTAKTFDDLLRPEPLPPREQNDVLVSVVPRVSDFDIVNSQHWYRIPCAVVSQWATPAYLAFYHGQGFREEAGQIRYYAPVLHVDIVRRVDMFPDEPRHPRARDDYYRVHVDALQQRSVPIRSKQKRQIVLMPTTFEQFMLAGDINELTIGDDAVDSLYGRMTEAGLRPERCYHVRGANAYYFTDFALLSKKHKVQIDVDPDPAVGGFRYRTSGRRVAPADGWTALRLSRFAITRRTDESIERVKQALKVGSGSVLIR
jgi:hypothetical protein